MKKRPALTIKQDACFESMIPPPSTLDLSDPALLDGLGAVPNTVGVYLLTPAIGQPYLGWSASLSKRLRRLLLRNPKGEYEGGTSPRTALCENLTSAAYWLAGSRLETSLLLYYLARQHDPVGYRKRLKLRDPWFVCLLSSDRFPRLAVRNRISRPPSAAYGPFRSRETAERFEQELQALFQTRRCHEVLTPSEQHPGCIYGEMNLCLRPCQKAVSDAEYAAEVSRLDGFLHSNGSRTLSALASARDHASDNMDFEEAARLHVECERIKAVADLRDPAVAEIDSLNGLALTRASGAVTVAIWIMLSGFWQNPLSISFNDLSDNSKSMDSRLRELLGEHISRPNREGIRAEHIALFSKWYYSSTRDGEWFGFKTLADLNYRKLVRSISNLLREDARLREDAKLRDVVANES
jgi:excinuclease ABC subunit C